ncbi:MAG: hypothetical protein OEW77_08455, partial [Gemmatimonadota bacterium]|nr:hypothetical protein [Gemmatimonadota bacterium]
IVSLSGGAKVVGGAVSFTGVDPQTPLGSFTAVGGSDNTIDPYLSLGSTVGDGLAFAVVATEGSAGSLTPSSGQVGEYVRFYGSSGGDVAGAAGVASGAAATSMSWTKSGKAKWSIGAVVLRRAPSTGTGVDTYQASFWAVRGKSRTLQINYISGGTASPYLRFTASDPKYVPGRGTLAMGDSVLITVTLDPSMIGAEFEPAGLTFGTPSSLTYWYGVLGGDLNGDGVVDNADAYIAQQSLGMWYRASATSAWTAMASTASALDMSVSSGVEHFSEYAVSW